MTPLAGWLAVRLGRKRVFLAPWWGSPSPPHCAARPRTSLRSFAVPHAAEGICGAGSATAVAGHPAGQQPERETRARHGHLGHGRGAQRAHRGAAAGRPAHRRTATNWRWVFPREHPGSAILATPSASSPLLHRRRSAKGWAFDMFRFRLARHWRRRVAAGARPRRAQGLVSRDSTEIRLEAASHRGHRRMHLFITHTATAEHSFISRALFHRTAASSSATSSSSGSARCCSPRLR